MRDRESDQLNERDQLKQRIFRLLDGEMEAHEVSELDLELQRDSEARALYVKFATLHSALQVHHDSSIDAPRAAIDQINHFIARQKRRFIRFSTMAAAALLLFSALAIWTMHEDEEPVLASFQASDESVFTLTHKGREDNSKEQLLRSGSRLNLTSGTIEAIFSSGVRCVIEAPCEIVCLSTSEVSVPQGKAWFNVPPSAKGFTVRTPKLDIVDLGTEFCVVAGHDGEDEIHVSVGAVEAAPRQDAQTGNSPKREMLLISAGEARRIDHQGNLVETAFHSARFTSSLSQPLMIRNASFENTDSLTDENNKLGYGPIHDWATSGLGVGMNTKFQPFLNQSAHSGSKVAFIQSKGLISQSVSGFDPARLYTITYFVSERGLPDAAANTSASLDLGSSEYIQPGLIMKTDAFRRIVTDPLKVFGPSANIEIRSKNDQGDATLLIDSVSISRAVPRIPDGGFEVTILKPTHFLQAHKDNTGQLKSSSWSFERGAGIIQNHSPFLVTLAPEGSQAAVFQSTGASAETTIENFEPGVTYRLRFAAKGRDGDPAEMKISLNDMPLHFNNTGTFTPLNGRYQRFSSDSFQTNGGSLNLKIESLTNGVTFIDDLHFEFVAEAE